MSTITRDITMLKNTNTQKNNKVIKKVGTVGVNIQIFNQNTLMKNK